MYFVSFTFLIMSLNLSFGLNCSREIGAEKTTKIESGVIKRSLPPTATPDILNADPFRSNRNESEVFLNPVVRLILLRHKNASQDIWADVIDVVGGELRHRVSDYLNEIWPENQDIENGTESSWQENEEVELGDIEIEAASEREAVIESDAGRNVSRLSALINGHNRSAHDRVARLALSEETRRLIARHINELSPLETAVFVPLHVTLRLLEEADLVAEIPVDGRKRSLMSTAFSVGQVFSVIRNIPDRLRSAWYKAKDIETQCMFRSICDISRMSSSRIPEWLLQLSGFYFLTWSHESPFFRAWIDGLLTDDCGAFYPLCSLTKLFLNDVDGV